MEKTSFVERSDRCATCQHAEPMRDLKTGAHNGEFECHRMPPTAMPVILPDPQTGAPRHVATVGAWPPVKAHGWCGEWAERDTH